MMSFREAKFHVIQNFLLSATLFRLLITQVSIKLICFSPLGHLLNKRWVREPGESNAKAVSSRFLVQTLKKNPTYSKT